MKRINVAELEFVRMEPRGRAVFDKFWVSQDNILRLVKVSGFKIDQDIMEALSSKILKYLGIDCVDVDLGYDKLSRKKCCLVSSFLTDEGDNSYDMFEWNLVSGNNALNGSFEQVFDRYKNLYGIDEQQLENLKKSYIRIIFGKCILENFDSKLENIGLIFNEKTLSYRLPPSFDNGFAFKSYNSFTKPLCYIGNQFFEIEEVIEYIITNYLQYIEDVIPRLNDLVEKDIFEILSKFKSGIVLEKQNYIISYLQNVNSMINELVNKSKMNLK